MNRRSLTLAALILFPLGTGLRFLSPSDTEPVSTIAGEEPPAVVPAEGPVEDPIQDYGAASPLVAGQVLDAEGRPVAGAEIRFTLDPESRLFDSLSPEEQTRKHSVRSDALGRFRIDTLTPGAPYEVLVVRRGHAPLLTAFSLYSVGLTPDLRLVLRPGKTVRGLVLDGKGRPVEGLQVLLQRSTYAGIFTGAPANKVWPDDDLYRTRTGPDGRFEMAHLPEHPLDLAIWGSTFAPLLRRGILLPTDLEVVDLGSFHLQPGVTFEGRVTDLQGTPLPGAVIGAPGQDEPVTESERNGRFAIEGLSPGSKLLLSICRPGFRTVTDWFAASGPEAARIVLEPAARVTGQVISPDSSPVAGAKVLASLDGSGRSWSFPAPPCPADDFAQDTTDAQGRFTLQGLAPGPLSLWVMAEGHPKEVVNVDAGASTSPLTVTLRPGAVLAGRILDPAGRPVSGATILDDDYLRGHPRALSGPDGTYRLTGVAVGARSLSVSHPDHKGVSKTLRIEPGENRFDAELPRIPRHPVHGRVLSPDGQPVAGARVQSDGKVAVATASDGTFVLLMERGGYFLEVQAGSHAPASLEVEVESRPVQGVDLRLSRGITLTGRIAGITPEELARATVSALPRWKKPFEMDWQATIDSEGRYRLQGLFPDQWTLAVQTRQRDLYESFVLAPGDEQRELDVTLPPFLTVRGRVIGPQGEPVAGASVRFSISGDERAIAGTEADGSFSVNVREGTYEVQAEGDEAGYLMAVAPPLAVQGPVEGVAIRLPKGITLRGRLSGFKPLEEISVYAHNGSSWRSAAVTRDGEYRLPGLPPGEWEVEAHSGVYTVTGKVRLAAGRDEAELDLAFVPGNLTLSGRIAGAADLPSFLLVLDKPGLGLDVQAEADEKGEFRFPHLHAGTYRLTLYGDSGLLYTTEIELSEDREVALEIGKLAR